MKCHKKPFNTCQSAVKEPAEILLFIWVRYDAIVMICLIPILYAGYDLSRMQQSFLNWNLNLKMIIWLLQSQWSKSRKGQL